MDSDASDSAGPPPTNSARRPPVLALETTKVRQLRRDRRLTQLELANLAMVSERTVRAAETGKRVRIDSLERIAKALGATFGDLIAESDTLRFAQYQESLVDQLMLSVHAYCEHHDTSEFARIFCPQTRFDILGHKEIPITGRYHGLDGLDRARDRMVESFVFAAPTEVVDIRASGGIVVIQGFDTMQPISTGLAGRVWWQHVYEFEQGKIARITETFDTLSAYRLFFPTAEAED